MLTESVVAGIPEIEDQPRLLAVEVGEWPGLGCKVRLELSRQCTVLVGQNGAGKSLILEGIFQAAHKVISPLAGHTSAPRYFRCDLRRPGASSVAYEYVVSPEDAAEPLDALSGSTTRARVSSWAERCWELPDDKELWHVANSTLTLVGHNPVPFFPGVGLLSVDAPPDRNVAEATQLENLFFGIRFVPAGIPRSEDLQRREILLSRRYAPMGWRPVRRGRAESLAHRLLSISEHRRDFYDEFVELAQQLGLAQDVAVKIYKDPQPSSGTEQGHDFASVLFDGLNIGLQSDGTLRIAEIILNLIDPDASVILIEEPETAVHPGLLSRLLALIEAYAFDRQIVFSTHSPIVVDWCKPDQLRLVERVGRETRIHALDHGEVQKVIEYLQDEGTFSDFLFGREAT